MDNYLYPKYKLRQLSIKRFEIYVTKVRNYLAEIFVFIFLQ